MGALGNLTLVLVIVIYIFAVIGMQLLGSGYTRAKWESLSTIESVPTHEPTCSVHNLIYLTQSKSIKNENGHPYWWDRALESLFGQKIKSSSSFYEKCI